MNGQMALFVDFENIAIWAEQHQATLDIDELMEYLRGRGAVVIKRAYADWANFTQYRHALDTNAIDLVQVYAVRDGKNRADVRMALDAFETAIQHPQIPVVVIVSGDSDFGPLVNKLRAYGKFVVGISPRAIAHRLLISACDEFVYLEAATGAPEKQPLQSISEREDARRLLAKAMSAHEGRGELPVLATRLKQTMLSMDPTFSEANLGYGQFRTWLEANHDLVTLFFRDLQLFAAPVGYDIDASGGQPAPKREEPAAAPGAEPREELLRRYRAVFSRVIFVDLQTRRDILLDIYCELSPNPFKYTSEEVLGRLQDKYEAEGMAHHASSLLRVWQTGFYQRAFEFRDRNASFKVPVRLAEGIESAAAFVLRVESGFIYAVLKDELEIDYAGLAEVLLDDPSQTPYIRSLFADVRQRTRAAKAAEEAPEVEKPAPAGAPARLPGTQGLASAVAEATAKPVPPPAAAGEPEVTRSAAPTEPLPALPEAAVPEAEEHGSIFPKTLASPYLHPVMDDIANAALPGEGPFSAETAARLAREATDARYVRNFGAALLGYLQACRVQVEVMQEGGEGARVEELAWYMASYASVRAGALSQARRDYVGARPYYLAFFYLLRIEPTLWERVEGLIAPMLHHYWANVGREMGLEYSGPAQPARLALNILESKNPALRAAWNQANQVLADVNPELLRWVVGKIKEEQQNRPA